MFPHVSRPPDKARWRTLLFKELHMTLPSLLSFPLPTPTRGIPWDTVPRPILMVGKHILIDACVRVWRPDENAGVTQGNKRQLVIVFFVVGMMTHLSSKMDRHPGTPSGGLAKDTNGRWLIGNWGKWLLWYWNHHWCNVIEMTMTYVSFCFYHVVWQKTKGANININSNK